MNDSKNEENDDDELLRDSEIKYRALFEQAADSIVLIDPETGELVDFNDVTYKNLGYTRDEFKKLKIPAFEIIETPEEVKGHFFKVLTEGADLFETKQITKSGEIIDVYVSAKAINIHNKKYIQAIWRNITERKRAEQKLKESEEKYRNIYENSPNAIALLDFTGNIIDCNSGTETIFGYSRDELIGQNYLQLPFYSESMINVLKERFQAITKGGGIKPQELEVKRKDGEIARIKSDIANITIRGENFFQAIIQDITEQKKAEEKLKESEKNFRDIANNANDCIFIGMGEGKIVYANERASEVTGYSIDELLKLNIKNLLHPDEINKVMERFKKRIDGKPTLAKYETILLKKDGPNVCVEINAAKTEWKGEPADLAILRDISDRKKTEQKLKESEESYRLLFEKSPIGIGVVSPGKVLKMNSVLQEITGYSKEEVNMVGIQNTYVSNEQRSELFQILSEKGFVRDFEVELRRKDNSTFTALLNMDSIGEKDENTYLSIMRDITERKKAEQKLKESEKKFRAIFEALPDLFFLVAADTTILEYSGKMEELYIPPEEFLGKKAIEILPPEVGRVSAEHIKKAINSKEQQIFEYKLQMKDGIHYYEGRFLYFSENKVVMFIRDITERKKAEQKLKESEEKYRMLVEKSLQGICILQEVQIIFANKALSNILGYSVDDLLSMSKEEVISLIHPDDREFVLNRHKERLKGKPVPPNYQFRIIRKDGTPRIVEIYASLITFNNKPAVQEIFIDITEQKNAEENLKESEEKYRTMSERYEMLLESITDGVYAINRDWVYTLVNKLAEKLVNMPRDNLLGHKITDVFPGIEQTPFFKTYEDVMNSRIPNRVRDSFNLPNGHIGHYEVSVYPITEGILCIARDITEEVVAEQKLKKSEEDFREAYERAEFYKDLFAHDISNILQNIQSSLGLLSMWENKPEKINKINELMIIINDQLIRGSKLVSNIRKLSEITETVSPLEKVDGIQILKEAKGFIHKSLPNKDINIAIESQIKEVKVNANQLLLDVFENILFNGIKYNENKRIEIFVKISREFKNGTNYAKFEFIDNGIGVPDVMKEHIFKGISDRKEKTHGMGLGLLLVKRVLSEYNGDIWVEDKVKGDPSQGSNFIILIPELI